MAPAWLIYTCMLLFGTCTSVCMKVMLTVKAAGYHGVVHDYDKPFMQSMLMFFGMAFSYFFNKCWKPEKKDFPPSDMRQKIMVCIPSAFDLFASTLMTFGLIYINASIFQMLRGSMVIFSAIFSIIFLKRKLPNYQWFSIGLTTVALVMIGVAGCFIPTVGEDEEGGTKYDVSHKILGCVLVVLSQIVQAGQIVTEEFILKDVNMPALEIVGWEGIWGMVMMVLVAFPFAFICPGHDPSPLGGSLENFMDSFIQLFTNGTVALICGIFLIAVLFYNIFGMLVTSTTSAVFRTILEAARTMLIWVVMLICCYADVGFGEYWVSWSWLELAGFVILAFSSFVYNATLKLPFFTYAQEV